MHHFDALNSSASSLFRPWSAGSTIKTSSQKCTAPRCLHWRGLSCIYSLSLPTTPPSSPCPSCPSLSAPWWPSPQYTWWSRAAPALPRSSPASLCPWAARTGWGILARRSLKQKNFAIELFTSTIKVKIVLKKCLQALILILPWDPNKANSDPNPAGTYLHFQLKNGTLGYS